MSPTAEENMSALKRLWTNIARFAQSLEGIDDPFGDYIFSIFSLGKRVDKLERDLAHFERQLHSRAGGGAILDPADG
jgi:hypothetical protein